MMAGLADGASARKVARWAGAFYLVIMVGAIFAEAVVRGGLVVSGDAAATAAKISASQELWRWGVLADVAVAIGDVAVGVLLFLLLAPVSKALSFGAAAVRLVYSAVILANAGLFLRRSCWWDIWMESPRRRRRRPWAWPCIPCGCMARSSPSASCCLVCIW